MMDSSPGKTKDNFQPGSILTWAINGGIPFKLQNWLMILLSSTITEKLLLQTFSHYNSIKYFCAGSFKVILKKYSKVFLPFLLEM